MSSLDEKMSVLQEQLDTLKKQKEDLEEKERKELEKYVESLTTELENILKDKELTVVSIVSICFNLMQVVENYPKLKGEQKKKLVLDVLCTKLQNTNGNMSMLDLLPELIEHFIQIEKGELTIKVGVEEVSACCGTFCKKM